MTPTREPMARHLALRRYKGLSNDVVNVCVSEVIEGVAAKIKKELTHICSDDHDSLLRGYGPSIKNFSWDTIWTELEQNTPCLLKLLSAIIPGNGKILQCTIICMILKNRYSRMALLQRVVSVMLYGNAVHKQVSLTDQQNVYSTTSQVHKNLQCMMLCVSHKLTLKLVDKINAGYNETPMSWREDLLPRIQVS